MKYVGGGERIKRNIHNPQHKGNTMSILACFALGLLVEGFFIGSWSFVAGVIEEENDGLTWAVVDGLAWTVGSIILFPITTIWGWIRTGIWIFCHD